MEQTSMKKETEVTAFTLRLKPNIMKILDTTASTMGLDRTATITTAIRTLAKIEGIDLKEEEATA